MPRDTCSKQLGFTASGPKRTSFTFTCMRQILHFPFTLWFSNIAKGGNPLLDNNQKVVKLNKHLEVGRIKTRFKIIYSWQLFKFYKILLAPQQRAFRLISTKDENKLQWAPKLLRHCTQIGKLHRTKESIPRPASPFKVGVFVVFYKQLELRHNIAWTGWGKKSFIFPSGSQ